MEAVKSLIRERERTMDQTIRKESASLQKG
jgi:hypothetical protein